MDSENIPSAALIGIQFDFLTSKDTEKFSNFDIIEKGDVTSSKLGLPNTSSQCATCGSIDTRQCDGHCGLIRSAATIFNPYFISEIVQILNHICPGCKSLRPSKVKDSIALESIEKSIEENDAYHLLALGKTLKGVKKKLLLTILKSKLSLQRLKITSQALKLHGNYLKKFQKATKKWANVNKKPGCGYCLKSATDWYPTIRFKIVPDNNLGKKNVSVVAEIGISCLDGFRIKLSMTYCQMIFGNSSVFFRISKNQI